MKACWRCDGTGLDYDGIERAMVTCDVCDGSKELPDPVAETSDLETRARVIAEATVTDICKAKERPRTVIERALIMFARSERNRP